MLLVLLRLDKAYITELRSLYFQNSETFLCKGKEHLHWNSNTVKSIGRILLIVKESESLMDTVSLDQILSCLLNINIWQKNHPGSPFLWEPIKELHSINTLSLLNYQRFHIAEIESLCEDSTFFALAFLFFTGSEIYLGNQHLLLIFNLLLLPGSHILKFRKREFNTRIPNLQKVIRAPIRVIYCELSEFIHILDAIHLHKADHFL